MSPAEPRGDRRNVLIVGSSPAATELARALAGSGWLAPEGADTLDAIDEELLAALGEREHPEVTLPLARRIARLAEREPFVLAGPRFARTLPAWRPLLGADCAFVSVFDDPPAGAADAEGGREQGFARWTAEQRAVLDLHRHAGDWLFVRGDDLRASAGRARLAAFVGGAVPAFRAAPGPEPQVDGSERVLRPIPAESLRTYAELCRLAAALPRGARAPAA